MNERSVKQVEKLFVVATIIILMLLFFLKTYTPFHALGGKGLLFATAAAGSVNEPVALARQHEEGQAGQTDQKGTSGEGKLAGLAEEAGLTGDADLYGSQEATKLVEFTGPVKLAEPTDPIKPREQTAPGLLKQAEDVAQEKNEARPGPTGQVGQARQARQTEQANKAGQAVQNENIPQDKVNLAIVKTDGDLALETRAELIPGPSSGRNLRVLVHVANKGGATASGISLEVPLLGNLDSPYQALLKEVFSPEPLEIKEHSLGNRTAVFNVASLAPGTAETITLDYILDFTPLTADLTAYNSSTARAGAFNGDAAYLRPADKIESSHPEIAAKAGALTAGLENNLDKAQSFFSFVLAHMKYDLNAANRNCGALAALRSAAGVCEDYAALFAALCRAEGIPARVVNGYTDPRGRGDIWNLSPGETLPLKGYRHCWAEFYLEGMGWLPADPTLNIYCRDLVYFASLPRASHLAQNYADQSIRVRFQGGQLDVTWEEGLTGL